MPIGEMDIPLFTITRSFDDLAKIEDMIQKMIEEAKDRMVKEKIETENCYPEISHLEEKGEFTLTIYRRNN